MKITKELLFNKLLQHLNHDITLVELVDWAENAMMESEFDEKDHDVIENIIARLGLADVKAFGLTWEEIELFINQLGYKVKLNFEYV